MNLDLTPFAIHDAHALSHVERRASTWMLRALGMSLGLRPWATVDVLPVEEIARIPGASERLAGWFTAEWIQGEGRRRPLSLRVLVREGLPAKRAFTVLAHELTHLWQAEHYPSSQRDPHLVEGFATWVEYQACLDLGDREEASCLLDSTDPVYGVGLRKMLAFQGSLRRSLLPLAIERLAKGRRPLSENGPVGRPESTHPLESA